MKIGLVCPYPSGKDGGVKRHVEALYHEFTRMGETAKIIIPGSNQFQGIPEEHVISIGFSMPFSGNGSAAGANFFLRPWQVGKILEEEKFDILHFHNMDWGISSLWILRVSRAVNIVTFHGALDGSDFFRRWKRQIITLAGFFYGDRFAGGIGVSETAKSYLQLYLDRFPAPSIIVPNGTDTVHFKPGIPVLDQPEFHDGRKTLLFVGRFEKRKGLLDLLRAYSKIVQSRPDTTRLIIGGTGSSKACSEAREFVRQHKLVDDVSFVGRIPEALLPSYYATADLLCAPSLYGESFGMILFEAMACGTVPVGYANAGYAGALRGFGTDHLLVPPGDWEALAAKIEQLLDDTDLYERARTWGLKHAHSVQFTWSHIAKRILAFYEEVRAQRAGT
ncbi:glycosyltransferase family 4 protein [Patescibacteria group bacterium]|nr:glycosyltransferase family 4 protein [Patescibacteria group bacterium]